jgi:hypothetical protein
MARLAPVSLAIDPRHASYTHIVLHATPLPVAISDRKRVSSLSTGDGIAIASAIVALVAALFVWRAVVLAKRSLQETQKATLATLAAANVIQQEAEYLRNERARRPNLVAHLTFEPITIDVGGAATAQIDLNGVRYGLIRFQLSVENDGSRESQTTTTRYNFPEGFLNWNEVPGVSRGTFLGELHLPTAAQGKRVIALGHPHLVGIGTAPDLGTGRCWVPVGTDYIVEWEALSERDRFPLDGTWGTIRVRVDAKPSV